jgi:lipopolysaccharide/colanic/teichoic acid biosynthesis glycosyltransferase
VPPELTVDFRRKPVYEAVTRVINILTAVGGLMLMGPVMVVIAAAIKLSDRRAPIFYRGRRIGRGGRPYGILKFRTMVPGTEQVVGARLIERKSPLITPLGRLLRRRKLDELPQLFNVLRGDMNLVGPRPVRPAFLGELRARVPGYERRFAVPPGITGLAQVRGGYYTDPRNKLRYELLYIRRRSVWLDLKLIAATLFILASRTLTMFTMLFFLLAFVVFVPTTFLPGLHVNLFGLRVNMAFLAIAALAAAWLIRSLLRRGFLVRRTPADKYIAGFVFWALLGGLLNPDAARNLLGVLYICSGAFVVYFLATQSVERAPRKIRRYGEGIALITLVVSVWGVLAYTAGWESTEGGLRAASLLGNPNVLALYLAIAFPLLLALRQTASGRMARAMWGGTALLACLCMALTFSRSGYLAFAVATLAFLFRYQRRACYGFLALCLLVLAAAELSGSPRLSVRQTALSSQALRMLQVYGAVLGGSSQDDQLVGVGWRNWSVTLAGETSATGEVSPVPAARPRMLNNTYLTLLVEHGIVGLFFMLLIFVAILGTIYEGSRRIPEPSLQALLWAIFSAGLGFMANMLFFDSFYFIAVQVTIWLLLGLGMGIVLEFGGSSRGWYRLAAFQH